MNNKSELEFRVILENDKMVQKFKKSKFTTESFQIY